MAINEVSQPSSGTSSNNNDYTYQNNNIDVGLIPKLSIFNEWENTTIEPVIAQGTFIYMGGLLYECQGSNETISGTPAAGINYIVATVTGTVMTLSWSTSKAGYTFNSPYGGNYSGSNQILLDICYKDGTAFRRARSLGMDLDNFYVANGTIYFSGGLNTNGNDIDTGGGDIDTGGGLYNGVKINSVEIDSNGRTIRSSGGAITTDGGTLLTNGGLAEVILETGGSRSGKIIYPRAIPTTYTEDLAYGLISARLPHVENTTYQAGGQIGTNAIYAVKWASAVITIYYGATLSSMTITSGNAALVSTAFTIVL